MNAQGLRTKSLEKVIARTISMANYGAMLSSHQTVPILLIVLHIQVFGGRRKRLVTIEIVRFLFFELCNLYMIDFKKRITKAYAYYISLYI